jgi:serine/threonine protein kinase
MINNKYKVLEKIGKGSFGYIFKGQNIRTNEFVAIKVEPIESQLNLLKNESKIYQYLLNTYGVPQVKWYGKDDTNYYMVLNLLGKSLDDIRNNKGKFTLRLTLQIGIKLIKLLKEIHNKCLIHRDIKPDNFLLGENNSLYLIDFGLCKTYINDNKHIEYKKTSGLIGSLTYASINSHENIELSRRDDLESLCYMLIYLNLGFLPWKELSSQEEIINCKKNITKEESIPEIFKIFLNYVKNLDFKERPNYELIMLKFKNLIV